MSPVEHVWSWFDHVSFGNETWPLHGRGYHCQKMFANMTKTWSNMFDYDFMVIVSPGSSGRTWQSPKTNSCENAKFVVTDDSMGCHKDNPCSATFDNKIGTMATLSFQFKKLPWCQLCRNWWQWPQSWHYNNPRFSVERFVIMPTYSTFWLVKIK